MAGAILAVLFLLVGVGGCLLLYVFVRGEAAQRRVMDRGTAERAARRDTDDDVTDRP